VPSRTAVATLTTATSATTAAAAIPSAAATTTRPFFTSAGEINSEVTAVQISAIQGTDGFLGFFLGAHGNEGESARAAAFAIGHELGFEDGAVGGESVLEIVFSGVEGEISDKQFIIHAVVFFFFRIARGFRECSRIGFRVITEHCSRDDLPRLEVSNPTVSTIDPFGEDRKTLLRVAIGFSRQRNEL
jgi:hypothetical protein